MTTPSGKISLVIGGGGFIGSQVVRTLCASGRAVRVFGRSSLRARNNLDGVEGVEIFEGDVANHGEVEAALDGVEEVLYLVHTTVPASSMKDLTFDLETNVPPLIYVVQSLARHETARRLVFLSSGGTVYGDVDDAVPITEHHPLVPISSYGLTKMIAEHYIRLCLAGGHVAVDVLRPSNVYGPRQNLDRPQGAVGHFLRALQQGTSVTIFGDGGTVRDYLYVRDLAEAVRLCLDDSGAQPGVVRTFNVGTGSGVSLRELIGIIEGVVAKPLSVSRQPARGFDCEFNVLSPQKIGREIGWTPEVELEEGIRETWRWMEETVG